MAHVIISCHLLTHIYSLLVLVSYISNLRKFMYALLQRSRPVECKRRGHLYIIGLSFTAYRSRSVECIFSFRYRKNLKKNVRFGTACRWAAWAASAKWLMDSETQETWRKCAQLQIVRHANRCQTEHESVRLWIRSPWHPAVASGPKACTPWGDPKWVCI